MLKYFIRITNQYEPVVPRPEFLKKYGFQKRLAPFYTEAYFFPNSIIFGAGSIQQAHTDDEHIRRKDLVGLPARLIEFLV